MTPVAECPGCEVPAGAEHLDECDIARCLVTGLQLLACMHEHDHGRDTWQGSFPGVREAIAFGFWTRQEPGRGWVRCGPGDGHTYPDLNRLYSSGEAWWDPAARGWVLTGDGAAQAGGGDDDSGGCYVRHAGPCPGQEEL